MTQADPAAVAPRAEAPFVSPRVTVTLSWTLWGLSMALAIAGLFLWAASDFATPPARFLRGPAVIVADLVLMLACSRIGTLLTLRRPSNPIGWIFQAMGVVTASVVFTSGYVTLGTWRTQGLPGLDVVAWLNSSAGLSLAAVLAILAILLFPDGRCVTPRWTGVGWVAGLGGTLLTVGFAITPGTLMWYPGVYNPLRTDTGVRPFADLLSAAGFLVITFSAVAAGWSMVVRYRRANEHERLQLKWVACAILVLVATASVFLVGFATGLFAPFSPEAELALVAATVSGALPPIAAAIAIQRYRLYDIDLIINKTLVWVPLTAVLGGLYAASVALFQRIFVAVTGNTSDAAIVVSTLILAGAFTPMRKMLEGAVDRRYRSSAPSPAVPPAGGLASLAPEERAELEALIERVSERVALRVLRSPAGSNQEPVLRSSGDSDQARVLHPSPGSNQEPVLRSSGDLGEAERLRTQTR